jgi:hypothetical protein
MVTARVEPVCVIDSVGRYAAKAATDAQRSAARAEAEDRVRAASLDATDSDLIPLDARPSLSSCGGQYKHHHMFKFLLVILSNGAAYTFFNGAPVPILA